MIKTLHAPGIEFNEIDRSQYNENENKSIINTVSFVCGFADKGEDYTSQVIYSVQDLQKIYGVPTNEPEQYFYNAGMEVLQRGGRLLMSKLPYDNEAKDKFTYVDYKLNPTPKNLISDKTYSVLNKFDNYLTNCVEISSKNTLTKDYKLLTLNELDKLETGDKNTLSCNTLRIVDITRSKYSSVNTNCVKTTINKNSDDTKVELYTNDCLGIIPFFVTPINALYFQNYSSQIFNNHESQVSDYNVISGLTVLPYKNNNNEISVNISLLNENYYQALNSNDILNETISKIAANMFPNIVYLNNNHFDTKHLKDIGIILFKAYTDSTNKSVIKFKLLESFIGSLDSNAKDPITHSTRFIEDIVNLNSKYIKLYTKIDPTLIKSVSTVGIFNQTATSLGFYNIQCEKKINYINSIKNPLETILNINSDRNRSQIDLVIDAGVSTIAQFVSDCSINDTYDFTNSPNIKDENWTSYTLDKNGNKVEKDPIKWRSVLTLFDTFCRCTRKDCMFIADGLRTFCLEGNTKIIRSTNKINTVKNSILTKLHKMTCLNSSYTAGYCDWFYIQDAYTSDLIWIPPSIKAAGIYLYIDTYYYTWDAPAGIVRGSINKAIDCAFSPNMDDAGKIYDQCWNYAINYPMEGVVLEGQKTMQIQQTAFDRVNVRRLFLYLEKQVIRYSKYFLYQGNTEYLRQVFVDTIDPIFKHAVNGNGIQEYYIKCDDENNTTHTIENNELHCQIFVKPIKTIEYIVLDFVCTAQDSNITETILES